MSEEYRKILNRPEAKHRYWHVKKDERSFFPAAHEIFELEFNEKIYNMKINHKDDIMTGQLYADYQFFEGNSIVIKKKKGGAYHLITKDAKAW